MGTRGGKSCPQDTKITYGVDEPRKRQIRGKGGISEMTKINENNKKIGKNRGDSPKKEGKESSIRLRKKATKAKTEGVLT